MAQRVIKKLESSPIDCYLITDEGNKNWLFNKGNYFLPGTVLVTKNEVFLATPSRNYNAFKNKYSEYTILQGGIQKIFEVIKDKGLSTVGIESNVISLDTFQSFCDAAPDVQFVKMPDFIEDIRMIKTEEEISLIAEAVKISDKAYVEFLNHLKTGQTEKQARDIFHGLLLKEGAHSLSFDLLLSSGKRCFLPHSQSTDAVIEKGDFVLMDFGIILNGYCSDTTRTVIMGEATDRQREVYALVLEAQLNALAHIREGVSLSCADGFARDVICAKTDKGCFDYGIGHGIGMLVHEKPRMHPNHHELMKANTVVSVEPGIYIEGFGGVRIEDLLVVGQEAPGRNLTHAPKELVVL